MRCAVTLLCQCITDAFVYSEQDRTRSDCEVPDAFGAQTFTDQYCNMSRAASQEACQITHKRGVAPDRSVDGITGWLHAVLSMFRGPRMLAFETRDQLGSYVMMYGYVDSRDRLPHSTSDTAA